MLFVETPYLTRFCEEHCSDDELRDLQQQLIERPDAGDLIRGAKGLRKLRWTLPGRGKSGGGVSSTAGATPPVKSICGMRTRRMPRLI